MDDLHHPSGNGLLDVRLGSWMEESQIWKEEKVRMGIDVGGTHTKAVAIDNATQQIIGKSSVKTTHDDEKGGGRSCAGI